MDVQDAVGLAQETVRAMGEGVPLVRAHVFPSALHCSLVHDVVQNSTVNWGVQDVSAHTYGSYTGQVSAQSAARMGASYGLVGHAEMRKHCGDDDARVVEKALRCKESGLVPVVCFGGSKQMQPVDHAKLLMEALIERGVGEQVMLAFEPSEAIGSGVAYDADAVATLASEVKKYAQGASFVYGGSVNAANVGAFVRSGIQGVLVGGSSQRLDAWCALLQAAVSAAKD